MRLDPSTRRVAFASLAGFSLLLFVVALVLAFVAPKSIGAWLVAFLVLLVLVVIAEVVLLVMDREPRPAAQGARLGPAGFDPGDDDVQETEIVDMTPVEDDMAASR